MEGRVCTSNRDGASRVCILNRFLGSWNWEGIDYNHRQYRDLGNSLVGHIWYFFILYMCLLTQLPLYEV
ncbi:hypothetical protein AQUCO_01800230v1 [Aquilegia coerulea]|uniref:Uncharacterized protein n=1 Tax=Aquilegia coerulea TaxID=218851 RepID=A0A2G5DKH9_AQUCA|nr:hypothetical protein AQUCO_01800230v1 [Aquilegia coerulea]